MTKAEKLNMYDVRIKYIIDTFIHCNNRVDSEEMLNEITAHLWNIREITLSASDEETFFDSVEDK